MKMPEAESRNHGYKPDDSSCRKVRSVRIIHPAIPSAIGRFANESDIIFTIDGTDKNLGVENPMMIIAAIIKI